MFDQTLQGGLAELVMVVGLAVCYKPGEEFLTEGQIVSRGYAPTEAFAKCCISRLIDSGAVEFKVVEPIFPDEHSDSTLLVKLPNEALEDIDGFVFKKTMQIKMLLARCLGYHVVLKNFSDDLISCECIEYCEYYAKRAHFVIVNVNHNNAKLKLLTLECSVNQIYMLLWRSMKAISQKRLTESGNVEFPIIIDSAFDLFINFRRRSLEIEPYNRPSAIKTSILSGMIELFKSSLHAC